jgi:hypothetical protein
MVIGIAGPYSAETEGGKAANMEILNRAAAHLLEKGHIPLIGVNAALEVLRYANVPDPREAMMQISLALINGCDALYFIAESPGANRERDLVLRKGLPVYYSLEEIPPAS